LLIDHCGEHQHRADGLKKKPNQKKKLQAPVNDVRMNLIPL